VCVYGTPVGLPRWNPPDAGPQGAGGVVVAVSGSGAWAHVTDPSEDWGSAGEGGEGGGGGGGGGSDGPDAHRAGPEETRGERNGDIFRGGRSGPGAVVAVVVAGRGTEAAHGRERRAVAVAAAEGEETSESLSDPPEDPKRQRSTTETALSADGESRSSVVAATNGDATVATSTSPDDEGQVRGAAGVSNSPRSAVLAGHPASVSTSAFTGASPPPPPPPPPPPQADAGTQRSAPWETETAAPEWLPAPQEPPGDGGEPVGGQRRAVSVVPPSLGASPFPALSEWGQEDGAMAPFVPDLLLAEVGPDMISRAEGPEVLWSEAAREGEGTVKHLTHFYFNKNSQMTFDINPNGRGH